MTPVELDDEELIALIRHHEYEATRADENGEEQEARDRRSRAEYFRIAYKDAA